MPNLGGRTLNIHDISISVGESAESSGLMCKEASPCALLRPTRSISTIYATFVRRREVIWQRMRRSDSTKPGLHAFFMDAKSLLCSSVIGLMLVNVKPGLSEVKKNSTLSRRHVVVGSVALT